MEMSYAVILIILVALLFDFLNGMNDAANSIATVVATHVLPPRLAVAWAAFFNSHFGIPISTTHTITGAIMGVGTTHRLSAVRWGVAANIIIAWATTIPACALASALALWLLQALDLPFLAGRAP